LLKNFENAKKNNKQLSRQAIAGKQKSRQANGSKQLPASNCRQANADKQ
jgi:hypothetical protein